MRVLILFILTLFISCVDKNEKNNEVLPLEETKSETLEIQNNEQEIQEVLEEIKFLYDDLIQFKDKPDFHTYGFSPAYKYNQWLINIGNLKNSQYARDILINYGFAIGDLEMLGLEYVKTMGNETEYSLWSKQRIENGLQNIKNNE